MAPYLSLVSLLALQASQVALTDAAATPYHLPQVVEPRAYNGTSNSTGGIANTGDAFSPPVYPSPWMNPDAPGWEEAYALARDFVSQMTLLEKVNLTTGVGYVYSLFPASPASAARRAPGPPE